MVDTVIFEAATVVFDVAGTGSISFLMRKFDVGTRACLVSCVQTGRSGRAHACVKRETKEISVYYERRSRLIEGNRNYRASNPSPRTSSKTSRTWASTVDALNDLTDRRPDKYFRAAQSEYNVYIQGVMNS